MLVGVGSPGAVSSNGRATALGFARSGAQLVLVDSSESALIECASAVTEAGGRCSTGKTDVTRETEIESAVRDVISRHGGVDVLHFNVAALHFGKIPKVTEEEFTQLFSVNARAALFFAKYLLPSMEQRHRGVFTHVSSVASVRHLGISSPLYDMSKAALGALTRHIAVQYAAKGIRANTMLLGMLDTPLARGAIERAGHDLQMTYERYQKQIPAARLGKAEEVANVACFLASEAASYITGAEIVVDGGLIARAG
jgi:NAD(P)-dependent dehydrogenase (short-subunit alcohol dehydrogenase family)